MLWNCTLGIRRICRAHGFTLADASGRPPAQTDYNPTWPALCQSQLFTSYGASLTRWLTEEHYSSRFEKSHVTRFTALIGFLKFCPEQLNSLTELFSNFPTDRIWTMILRLHCLSKISLLFRHTLWWTVWLYLRALVIRPPFFFLLKF